jgi:hypothetical protein
MACEPPTTSGAVSLWKPPLFAFGPTPPIDRKLVSASRRLDRLRKLNGTASWWQSPEVVEELLTQLDENHFAIIDTFAGNQNALELRDAVVAALNGDGDDPKAAAARAQSGRVGGGGSGSAASALRSDRSMWARSGTVVATPAIEAYVRRADALVAALRGASGDDGSDDGNAFAAVSAAARRARLGLRRTTHRSDAMLAVYPRGGSKYVRHTDNVCDPVGVGSRCNGRRLTIVLYLNSGSEQQQQQQEEEEASALPRPYENGALRLFRFTGAVDSEPRIDVSPLIDRLVLFWSDARVPHAVLPTGPAADRYATTLWYFDHDELKRANERLQLGGSGARQEVRQIFYMYT